MTLIPSPMSLDFQVPNPSSGCHLPASKGKGIRATADILQPCPVQHLGEHANLSLPLPSALMHHRNDSSLLPPISKKYKVSEWKSSRQSPCQLPPLQSSLPSIDRLQNEDPWSPPRPHPLHSNRQYSTLEGSSDNLFHPSPLNRAAPTASLLALTPWTAPAVIPVTSGTFNQTLSSGAHIFLPPLNTQTMEEAVLSQGPDTPHPFAAHQSPHSLAGQGNAPTKEVTRPLNSDEVIAHSSPHIGLDENSPVETAPSALGTLSALAITRLAEMKPPTQSPLEVAMEENYPVQTPAPFNANICDVPYDAARPMLDAIDEAAQDVIIVDSGLDVHSETACTSHLPPRATVKSKKGREQVKIRRSTRKRQRA